MAWITVKFDANRGTGGQTDTLYYQSKGLKWRTAASTSADEVTSCDVPTRTGYAFAGYTAEDPGTSETVTVASAAGVLQNVLTTDAAATTTAYAQWTKINRFGNVTDYFGLASDTLIPESSEDGTNNPHIVAYNVTGTGTKSGDTPATGDYGTWYNPRVTYRVVGDMTLAVTLGKGTAGVVDKSGGIPYKMSKSGYMIASVDVHTALGEAPTVTVSGVANEGYKMVPSGSSYYHSAKATDAVKTYAVSIPITARHRPQNLLSAVTGGGELQELTLAYRADPVVVAEDNMPCASDLCHARVEVTATTAAYNNEAAPTAGTGFTLTGAPVSQSGTGYKTYTASFRKEIA